ITQAQYKAVMKVNPSKFIGADLPVECVSWNDAKEFCKKLTEIEKAAGRLPTGYEYTLPTEAQWEYACRAGTTTALNSGKNLSDKYECPEMDEEGWYGFNSGYYDSDGNTTSNGKTFPVGQKQPNAWGLYDMHGNVYEWCLDWFGDYPTSSVTDPKGPSTGSYRVIRGGSWDVYAFGCRSALRYDSYPSDYSYFYGFRVALSLVQ
ncbi:MAG: formylglycine-generating enzyme family protein, partial [Verrucomicrobia bacterium]|nr:formylglycine-generating enzyme family protein [Verrucomicrobiota bacterium]